jgi:predicted nucleotidyltransferase
MEITHYRKNLVEENKKFYVPFLKKVSSLEGVIEVGIFGSYAKWTFTDQSDLDVYVIIEGDHIKTTQKRIYSMLPTEGPDIDLYFISDQMDDIQRFMTKDRKIFYKRSGVR